MSKTVLVLNGQTVILTSDAADAVVHGAAPLPTPLLEEAAARPGAEVPQQNGQAGMLQVQVQGREVPGFVVASGGGDEQVVERRPLHAVQGMEEGREALAGRTAASEGGFLPLPVVPSQGTAGLGERQSGGLGREVFTITTDRLGPGQADTQHLQGLADLVHLPLTAPEVKGPPGNLDLEEQGQGQGQGEGGSEGGSLSTLVAIIQAEDGTTHTIELTPEEACRLDLLSTTITTTTTTTATATTAMQPLADCSSSLVATVTGDHHLRQAAGEEAGLSLAKECPPVFPEGTGGLDGEGEGEGDVSLGPFLLIPEYNSDGSVSTVLQLAGTEAEATAVAAVPVTPPLTSHASHTTTTATTTITTPTTTSMPFTELKKPMTTTAATTTTTTTTTSATIAFPHSGQGVQRIRLPLAPPAGAAGARTRSVLRGKTPEWRGVALAPGAAPRVSHRVSGTTYLRDIAKRTKFRNLTSFLEGKEETAGPCETPLAPPPPPPATVRPLTATTGVSLLKRVPGRSTPRPASLSTQTVAPEAPPAPRDGTLTIRVSTGPINATTTTTAATTTTTTTTTTTLQPPPTPPPPQPISTPAPSIKCAELPESVGSSSSSTSNSNSMASSDSTSLTSIVYCSSTGDDTPFAVHLPGGDSTKPLGSSENPIQLVQQGNTFQALQPVQERQLEQITALLQQRRITAPPTSHHDEIYDPKTNMKIVYKVVYPEDVLPEEEEEEEEEEDLDVIIKEEEDMGCIMKEDDDLWEGQSAFLEKRRGRRPKYWRKLQPPQEDILEEDFMEESEGKKKPVSRTRSGRISRPPRHMMKDFKHLHPLNFNDDVKKRDSSGIGYLDYEEYVPSEAEKVPEPVITDLPRRKKREVTPLTRLRYTCTTCGKLYMGRIEAHYRKFPDHCRKRPPSPTDPKQSYSAIKTLSDAKGGEGSEGSEIHKSVLSPTPGTPASETSGEPGLPMETLTALPPHPQEVQQDPGELPSLKPEADDSPQTTTRARRGRSRRKGKAWHGRRGRPAKVSSSGAAAVAPPPTNPTKVLETILSAYTSQDIRSAVGRRLFDNLSPWQLLCLRVDEEGGWPQWQERLRLLENLLKECQEELFSQAEPRPRSAAARQVGKERGKVLEGGGGVPGNGAAQPPTATHNQDVPSGGDVVAKGDSSLPTPSSSSSSSTAMAVKKEDNGNFEVSDYLAGIFGVRSCEYQLRQHSSSPSSPLVQESPVPHVESYLCPAGSSPALASLGKRSLEDSGSEDTESPPKKRETEPEDTVHDQAATSTTLEADMTAGPSVMSEKKNQFGNGMDCVSSALEVAACDLELPPYSLPGQLSPVSSASLVTVQSTPPMLANTQQPMAQLPVTPLPITQLPITPLPVTLPHLSECVAAGSSSSTTLTTTHPVPCSTPTSSLPLEIPSFSTHSTSPPMLAPCLPLTSMDTSFIPTTTMPQVNTMQQMPLGDMDITAEDLPRLLSEGTGLVVGGSGDGCDAPKLLDTSGDTTDLSEMLFKLQEATASISQGQDNTLGPHLYQEGVNGNNPQLMTPESLHTPGVSLTAQDYGTVVGGTLNPHSNLTLKLDASQGRGEPSMPLLTFSGALNSEFHSDSTLSESVSRGEDSSKISAILNGVGGQQSGAGKEQEGDRLNMGLDSKISAILSGVDGQQNGAGKGQEGDRLSIGFGSSNLAMSEFEDLLKR